MCMNPKHIRELQTNEVLRKRLAKYITLHCFRNTDVLEDLHSGEVPISESGDYSDVKVITPDREIPWSDLSRFDNSEMKAMMIDVVSSGPFSRQEVASTRPQTRSRGAGTILGHCARDMRDIE